MSRPIKYCPYCGDQYITYADDEVPSYAWCPTCKTWISAGEDFTQEEVMYITQKLKSIRKIGEMLKRAQEVKE